MNQGVYSLKCSLELGHEIAQPLKHLVAHAVAIRHTPLRNHSADQRVEILAVALELEVEGHMVDAGAEVVDRFDRHADIARQLAGGVLHAVAQPDGLDLSGAVDRPAVHRHRVDVLQECHIGAELFHVAAHVQQHRDGAQPTEDPADAQRVGDRLAQAILLGNLKVDHRRGLVAADLDHADRVIGTVERFAAVGGGLDGRVSR